MKQRFFIMAFVMTIRVLYVQGIEDQKLNEILDASYEAVNKEEKIVKAIFMLLKTGKIKEIQRLLNDSLSKGSLIFHQNNE